MNKDTSEIKNILVKCHDNNEAYWLFYKFLDCISKCDIKDCPIKITQGKRQVIVGPYTVRFISRHTNFKMHGYRPDQWTTIQSDIFNDRMNQWLDKCKEVNDERKTEM